MSAFWKRLRRCALRSRGNAGWGERLFLTLWIPRAAYPVPYPEMPAAITERLGKPDGWGGFDRAHDDGTTTRVNFGAVSGPDPRARTEEGRPTPLFVTQRPGEGRPRFDWMEVRARTGVAPPDGPMADDAIVHDVSDPEWAWLADAAKVRHERHRWHETTARLDWCSDETRALVGECEFWSKTTYPASNALAYGTTYAVKPWYVRDFAIAAARLSRAIRAEGIDARWRGR